MAAVMEQTTMPVNGNYAHQAASYGAVEQAYGNANSASYGSAQSPATATANTNTGNSASSVPKEEVAWYFVEQYYNTLSRNPEKLFLYYNKRSQFVSGDETERVSVCLGQKAINDRIKDLDFQDCKVRITNVDSQSSDEKNIVIQTIGEISNKSKPHRKFVQTFVLAEQTNGYFVLNDIFRYLHDDEEEEQEEEELPQEGLAVSGDHVEPAPTASEPEPKGLSNSSDAEEREDNAVEVDKRLEEAVQKEETEPEPSEEPAQTNGTPAAETTEGAESEDFPESAAAPDAEEPSQDVAEAAAAEEDAAPEKPKDPEPTPEPAKATPAPRATPTAPPKPAVPKTWANLAAAAHKTTAPAPAAVAPASNTPKAKAAPAAQASTTSAPSAPAASTPPAREPSPVDSQEGAGWQSVGADHGRKQSRSQGQAGTEAPKARAYIKNVYPSMNPDELKASLEKCGEVTYFDISRQKNCAFVDFASPAGFQAALAANPHQIGSDSVYVEERREGPRQFGNFRGGMRGGRGGQENRTPGRGGFNKDGGRGGYTSRGGRGGSMSQRSRGGAQAA